MKITTSLLAFTLLAISTLLANPEAHKPNENRKNYSPYVNDHFPNQVFFGDTHLHTSYSADAGFTGTTLGPEEAYRFALGEEVTSSTGVRAKLQRPFDFLVVADHAENMGLAPLAAAGDPTILATEFGLKVHNLVKAGKGAEAFDLWRLSKASGKDPMAGESEAAKTVWDNMINAAEKFNQPGKFTAFIGYEWTSVPGGNNLHRNVIYRGGKDKAKQMLPYSSYDSENVEDLWKWMTTYEKTTGGQLLAIPHNGNLSNGLMFDDVKFGDKKPMDSAYAREREKWEPLIEVTQMKGDGESHPFLSPDDEFADFEKWDVGALNSPEAKTPDMLPREYARGALKRGLQYEGKLGINPFKFGLVGSTDSHTALATAEEDQYFGKLAVMEPGMMKDRHYETVAGRRPNPEGKDIKVEAWQVSSSGLAAVWSRENTREALWDAMKRKEVYATTGTRMSVRVFAGWNFNAEDLDRPHFARYGYANGVPMGADLSAKDAKDTNPGLLITAMKDPNGANLDRVQVIKGWLDKSGNTQEKVYDVAWSDDRKVGQNGKVPAVGNTVNVKDASYNNSIGAPILSTFWKDPDFSLDEKAFYYVRVLEIPTPRWTTYDAKVFGTKIPDGAPTSIQERAYTSPIWYMPTK